MIQNCTIQDYPNVKEGGAIYLDNSELTISDSTIKDNHAYQAGAIVILNLSTVTVTSTTFSGNEANQGGCFYISDSSKLTLNSCTITANKAVNSAVFVVLLQGQIFDSKFISNYLHLAGSTITRNEATTENSVGLFLETTGSVFDGTVISLNTMTPGTSK